MTLDKKVGYSVESKKKEKGTLNIFFNLYKHILSCQSFDAGLLSYKSTDCRSTYTNHTHNASSTVSSFDFFKSEGRT